MQTPPKQLNQPRRQERLVRPVYKSDRTEGRTSPADAVHITSLCTGCKKPMDCHWPPTMTFDGEPCTPEEYMAKALQSENVGIYCDDCLEKMPDVKLEDLQYQ